MKKKAIALDRKLLLHKETVAALGKGGMQAIAGGATAPDNGCAGSNYCDIRFTRDTECQLTDVNVCCHLTLYCVPETANCM